MRYITVKTFKENMQRCIQEMEDSGDSFTVVDDDESQNFVVMRQGDYEKVQGTSRSRNGRDIKAGEKAAASCAISTSDAVEYGYRGTMPLFTKDDDEDESDGSEQGAADNESEPYLVEAEPGGDGYWILRVPAIDRVTQARFVGEIDSMARDLIECMSDKKYPRIEVVMKFPGGVDG
jgi:hypothetical protein